MRFSRRVCVPSGKMLRIRKAGNGVISSNGALGSMSCGSILYPLSLGLYLWQMLAAIGETLEKEGDDEVMGVVVNARKGFYRIGLWTKSCTNQEVLKAIGYNPIPPLIDQKLIVENVSKKFSNSPTKKKSNSTHTRTPSEQVARPVQRRRWLCRENMYGVEGAFVRYLLCSQSGFIASSSFIYFLCVCIG